MRAQPAILVALLGGLLAVALVRRAEGPDPFSESALAELVAAPLDSGPRGDGSTAPFWKALFEHPAVTRTPDGLCLRLGRVLADPSAARRAAENAGELLALEAEGPAGKLGIPLWRAVLDGPVLQRNENGRTLALYGCRHSADADAGPVLEDSYYARLALAEALKQHALAQAGEGAFTLLGQETPVKGGVNFEVQLLGTRQSVSVTFDGHSTPLLRAAREQRPSAPNDARARATLIEVLRARAAAEGLGELTIEGREAPVENGVDLRLELVGRRLALAATRGGTGRLATHLDLDRSGAGAQEQRQ